MTLFHQPSLKRRQRMNPHSIKSVMMPFAIALALLIGAQLAATSPATAAEDIVQTTVSGPFDKVVTNLKREITGHQLVIVKEVPYQQMVKMVGVNAEPIMGFEIFHPRYGKVLYETDVSAFIDAPLRILVRSSSDEVVLEYRKPSAVFASYSGLSELGKDLDQVFASIVEGVAK